MTEQEVLNTRYGAMLDMINCFAIYKGTARLAKKKKKMSFEEAIELR